MARATPVLVRVIVLALLTLGGVMTSAAPVRAESTAQDLWDSLRAGTFGALDYGAHLARAVSGWLFGSDAADESRIEDGRSLLSFSDKEFREFDGLVHAAGYSLQGYSFGLDGASQVELTFDFERVLTERERAEVQRQLDQAEGRTLTGLRRTVIATLLDATRFVDAPPASGYRLAGLWMRVGPPLDVRVRFRRAKP